MLQLLSLTLAYDDRTIAEGLGLEVPDGSFTVAGS